MCKTKEQLMQEYNLDEEEFDILYGDYFDE